MNGKGTTALSVRGLTTQVAMGRRWVPVVRDVDLEIAAGQTVGIAGESGSGKSMLALSIVGLLPRSGVRVGGGSVVFDGVDLVAARSSTVRGLLGNRIGVVFQDPLTSLNPLFVVGEQIAEVIRRHSTVDRPAARRRARELLEAVHIPDAGRRAHAYPHELSGGQRQRVAIAMAIANEPDLLIADEPTTALDVTVQAEILELFAELQQRIGMAMLFITHDLGVASEICDRVAVMYAGRIVEENAAETLFDQPLHPYTRRLMSCAPRIGDDRPLAPIPGTPPAFHAIPDGCAFAERCDVATYACRRREVALVSAHDGRVACIRPGAHP